MARELETKVRSLFEAFDRLDFGEALNQAAHEVDGVDEISRRWLRTREELSAYMKQLEGAVADVRTEVRDPYERIIGDVGILTCWIEQDYVLQGEKQHVSAPTTVIYKREDGDWKMTVFHSIPLAEQDV